MPSNDNPKVNLPLLKLQIENEKLRRQKAILTTENEKLKAKIKVLNKEIESQDARILGFLQAQDDGTLTKKVFGLMPPGTSPN